MSRKALVPIQLPADPVNALEASTKQYVEKFVQSRGTNLVTNGTGLFQNNTNFSAFVYDPVENLAGSGAFTYNGADAPKQTDELIAVDPSLRYRLTYSIRLVSKSQAGETPNHYGYVTAFDADRLAIGPHQVMKYPGAALTTLAADLNPGATTITLTSAAGWYNSTSVTYQQIAFWPYTNAQGYTYPDYTYSRNTGAANGAYDASGVWLSGGITGNVITLRTAWTGPAYPAGTLVANMQSGGTYDYIAGANVATPSTWTAFSGTIGRWDSDTMYSTVVTTTANGMYMSPTGFRWGTAFVAVGWLLSYNTPVGTAKTAIDSVIFAPIQTSFDAAQGTPPFTVVSTTAVTNLNADYIDGKQATDFVAKAGDTMTGALTINSSLTMNGGDITQRGNGIYVRSGDNLTSYGGLNGGLYNSVTALKVSGPGSAACWVTSTDFNFLNPVLLAADPTAALGAATKQYADTRVLKSGDTMTGALTLPADPTTALQATTKQYVDQTGIVAYAEVTANATLATTSTAIPGLSVTATLSSSRRYVVRARGAAQSTVANDVVRLSILMDGATIDMAQMTMSAVNTYYGNMMMEKVYALGALTGSHTVQMFGFRFSGTGTASLLANVGYPSFVLIQDVGAR